MSTERVSKKLVPSLQNINGAIILVNAYDPQLSTIRLFLDAISDLPHFVILNKTDLVLTTRALEIAHQLETEEKVILTSILESRGIATIRKEIAKLPEGKLAILGVVNSGKSSLINTLTRENNPVSDMPGTTLEVTEHPYAGRILLDTSGEIIGISKPLMISIDLTGCQSIEEKLRKCMTEDALAIEASVEFALPGLIKAVDIIIKQVEKGNKIIVTGAGGSALVAMSIAGQGQETGLPIMVFTNNLTECQPVAFAKGIGETELSIAEYFSRTVNRGDIALGISVSGGTGFVYAFLELARQKGAITIAITENPDTPLGKRADIIIKSNAKPEGVSASRTLATHLAIGHALILTIADLRGIDAQKSIQYMLPQEIRTKRGGIK